MVIRFTSTLTPEDESSVAPALLKAVGQLLAPFPISYSMRIETTAGDVVEDGRLGSRSDSWLASGSQTERGASDGRGNFNSQP
jgi:hypothetical protein